MGLCRTRASCTMTQTHGLRKGDCDLTGHDVVWQLCRLQEKTGKMETTLLRVVGHRSRDERLTMGAVSGDMLYLTSFKAPVSGALLGAHLIHKAIEPSVSAFSLPSMQRLNL